MFNRKVPTLRALHIFHNAFCFRERPVKLAIRSTRDPRRPGTVSPQDRAARKRQTEAEIAAAMLDELSVYRQTRRHSQLAVNRPVA